LLFASAGPLLAIQMFQQMCCRDELWALRRDETLEYYSNNLSLMEMVVVLFVVVVTTYIVLVLLVVYYPFEERREKYFAIVFWERLEKHQ
jgi:hypothetical protein